MRGLAYGICAAFALLSSFSLYVAARTYEGTVEEDYYRKSLAFFKDTRGAVFLDISPKPVRAMRELVFTVELPGEPLPGTPWIELAMRGMTMPPNRVDLSADGNGRYRGKGMVVRCPSGGRTWTATVHVPGQSGSSFTFDVAD